MTRQSVHLHSVDHPVERAVPGSGGHRRERRVVRVRSAGFVPIEANLQRPRLRPGLGVRGELVDSLREHADVPVVLVTGPAGYGKTTLLCQWDDEDARPFTWLSLDQSANDPAVFVTYVILALQRLGDVDAGVLTALADESPVSTVLLPRLGRTLARQQGPFVLVLDNAESVTSAESLDVLQMIATHLNEGAQIAVAARHPPDLPWSQFRTEGRLLTIGPEQLRLAAAEVRAVLAAAQVELSDGELDALIERTEGWPAGIHLAALSLRQTLERRDALASFGGGGHALAGYLRDALLARVPDDQRQFLVRTSLLERMCAPLCDAVLETTGSGEMLRTLERSNLFVVPLDGQGEWYRYHRLFGDILRSELARESPAVVARLHANAGRWLEEARDVEAAVRHAQAAHEVERAARLVWSQTGSYLATGRLPTLRRWLEGFPNQEVLGHAKLALTAAWCARESGGAVDHWIDAAERGLFDASRPGEAAAVASNIALLHADRARDGVAQMRSDAELAIRLQSPDDTWRPFALYLQAVAVLLSGEADEARRLLGTAEQLAATLRVPTHQALCLAQLAVLAVDSGDWEQARSLTDRALSVLAEHRIDDSPSVSVVHCIGALVTAKAGQVEESRRLAQRAMRMVAVLNHCPAWLAVQTRYLLGRAHLLLGDSAAARVLLSEAQTQLHGAPDATWLSDQLAQTWTHVEQFPLATGMGPSALTSAELRVLQLLPTHLSFEQIGRRLSVSRNTVKTQAIAAYRKLGVSSRSEAVERARSLGMIQG